MLSTGPGSRNFSRSVRVSAKSLSIFFPARVSSVSSFSCCRSRTRRNSVRVCRPRSFVDQLGRLVELARFEMLPGAHEQDLTPGDQIDELFSHPRDEPFGLQSRIVVGEFGGHFGRQAGYDRQSGQQRVAVFDHKHPQRITRRRDVDGLPPRRSGPATSWTSSPAVERKRRSRPARVFASVCVLRISRLEVPEPRTARASCSTRPRRRALSGLRRAEWIAHWNRFGVNSSTTKNVQATGTTLRTFPCRSL